ncbi:hypothetical protein Aduo_001315 [Ancylostoma duodenale]
MYKIEFLSLFNKACQGSFRPGRELCIDESLVPFRGRNVFRQYIPSKRYRYGIKLFKMYTKEGYTYRTIVYAGKQLQKRIASVFEEVVMALTEGLLDSGGKVCFSAIIITPIPLASIHTSGGNTYFEKTNLVGTLWRNRKGLPPTVISRKLKEGQQMAQQKRDGVLVLKWRDRRDVLMLPTMHDDSANVNWKPNLIEEYNKGKPFIDISDQMASYTLYVRKTTEW